jgi:hypothetical protein
MTEKDKALCRDFIEVWIQTHPVEMGEFKVEMDMEKSGMLDPVYGENESKTMRKTGNMPQDLFIKLKKEFPGLTQNDNEGVKWILKEFPVFRLVK